MSQKYIVVVTATGTIEVEAGSDEEASELAHEVPMEEIDWCGDFDVHEVRLEEEVEQEVWGLGGAVND